MAGSVRCASELERGRPDEGEATMPESPEVAVMPDDRIIAMLSHLLGIFTLLLGPLLIYLIKKDSSRFVAFHSLQAALFQLALLVAAGLTKALVPAPLVGAVGLAVVLAGLVFAVSACIKSYHGQWYEYPLVGRWARQATGG
jgi:uncharacterized protein